VTLGDVTAIDVKDNVTTISAGADQVRIIFYRDDLFRLWLGPDGQFTDAQPNPDDAQMVVLSGAPVAVASRDAGDYYRIESQSIVLRAYKRPLRFAMFDKANATVIWQETKPITYGPSTVQTLKRGTVLWRRHAERLLLAPRHVGQHPAEHARLERRRHAQSGAVLHEH
jgi:hypothetical protein